jgi:hypothetical protein
MEATGWEWPSLRFGLYASFLREHGLRFYRVSGGYTCSEGNIYEKPNLTCAVGQISG